MTSRCGIDKSNTITFRCGRFPGGQWIMSLACDNDDTGIRSPWIFQRDRAKNTCDKLRRHAVGRYVSRIIWSDALSGRVLRD